MKRFASVGVVGCALMTDLEPDPLIALRPASPFASCAAAAGLGLLAGCASRPAPPPLSPSPSTAPRAALAPSRPLSLDSSIEAICAVPAGKAVLDRDLPGLTTRPEFAMFKAMTLKQLQPMSRGHITDAVLAKVQADLLALRSRRQENKP